MVPTIDEFGGYASRIRIPDLVGLPLSDNTNKLTDEQSRQSTAPEPVKMKAKEVAHKEEELIADDCCTGENVNLCNLLGIDVERLALEIVNEDLKRRESHENV